MASFSRESFDEILNQRKSRETLVALIIEDQKFSREMLKSFLRKNFTVHTAANAKEGLSHYMHQAPDIVFLDIELPDLSGFEICELINQLDKESYVVMVSGNNTGEDVHKAMSKGAKTYVIKPFTKSKIIVSLKDFLKSKNLELIE